MLRRFAGVVRNLVVSPERMMENLEYTRGTIFSGHLLLALVDKGVSREEAYRLVQRHALEAWDGGASLKERAQGDPTIAGALSTSELDDIFSVSRHLREVNRIVERALV
jgi:adenylosuccinate lyase